MMHRRSIRTAVLGLVVLLALETSRAAETVPIPAPSPRLAVVISADQFRGDYLQRFAPYFGEGGFKRLLAGGLNFPECRYAHAATKTAPGHATIASGVHPDVHGIVANEWLDPATGRGIVSVEDPASPLIGRREASAVRSPGGVVEAQQGRSPRSLLATTVGDQLKLRHAARSRVITLGGKDRSAILLGGRLADAAYWIDEGRVVTSRYYAAALPAWVERFNAEGRAERAFGSTWDRLLAAPIYDAVQGPDTMPGETDGRYGLAATFPKRLDGGAAAGISPDYYEAFDVSPLSTELLIDLAITALDAEQLGRHPAPDLLCLGLSQPDLAGHLWGIDSHEIMDSVLRLDRALARLLTALDERIGLAHCVIVFTADHGAAPLPERSQALFGDRLPAGRLDSRRLDQLVTEALVRTYGTVADGQRWVLRDGTSYHLTPAARAALDARGHAHRNAAGTIRDALREVDWITTVTTREELLAAPAEGTSELARLRRGFHPARSGDVVFSLAPYFIDRRNAGTTHGAPWDYDTHVPQLWFGAGVPAGERIEPVGVEDLAPTLSALLGIPRPPQAQGRRLF